MSLEQYMPQISDAARIVKALLPHGHALELADLVSIGAERVLRYAPTHPTLAFICAKQGMVLEAQRWRAGRQAGREQPNFVEYDEEWDSSVWRRAATLDVDLLIDLKRALLAMQLREAVAWYSHHWLGEDLDHLEREFGVSGARIRQYCATARDRLVSAWRGVALESHADGLARYNAVRERARSKERSVMLTERARRYAELRSLGANASQARRCIGCKARYLTLARQLTAEAAE